MGIPTIFNLFNKLLYITYYAINKNIYELITIIVDDYLLL